MPISSLEVVQRLFNTICPFSNNLCTHLNRNKYSPIHFTKEYIRDSRGLLFIPNTLFCKKEGFIRIFGTNELLFSLIFVAYQPELFLQLIENLGADPIDIGFG
jgi:hypothetical protein